MIQKNRLPTGGAINRDKPVRFYFDGHAYEGYEGDTLASALLANGVKLVGRSFKYHRPRGILSAGSEEPNALVELREYQRREPNTRAPMIELYDQLQASSQNRFPSLRFDFLSVNQLLSKFLAAGFYYKTFMWPASFWEPVYEKIIRRSAGLGRVSNEPDPDTYEHSHAHFDLVIVGAGASGLQAALTAAQSGVRVALIEEQPWLGGRLAFDDDEINGLAAMDWVRLTRDALSKMDNVTILNRTTVVGYYDGSVLAALERVNDHVAKPEKGHARQRLWVIRAKQIILATGAIERPLVFAGNDKPGVMLAGSVRAYVIHFGVAPGKRVAIVTNNDDAYRTALALQKAGIAVPVVVDAREKPGAMAQTAINAGLHVVFDALPRAAKGFQRVRVLEVQDADGALIGVYGCDCVAMSGGWNPNINVASQSGTKAEWREAEAIFVAGQGVSNQHSVGASVGLTALSACLKSGAEAANAALEALGVSGVDVDLPQSTDVAFRDIKPVWRVPGSGKAFVDFQNDVSASDIDLAHQEGFISVEHLKRYTTMGMATDQGKTSNVNGLAILAAQRGEPIDKVGTTRFRPPTVPVAIGAYAGHERGKDFQPYRLTAMHAWHEENGAEFVEAGQWLRPRIYPRPGEDMMSTIWRESDQVRKSVGLCDVSTLGKIEVFGPDAGEFLNRLYINGFGKLPVGKARYGLMLREDGHIFDDGTTSRLADDHFFMTATTASAARVLTHMEYHAQVVWPDLDVAFCSATEQWCGMALAGPKARDVLSAAFPDIDVSNEALPFMGVCQAQVDGATIRIFRISFSGELAYEINTQWDFGVSVWERIYAAGEAYDIIPYGTEALGVLRIEKGHGAGNEIDGRTTAKDWGMERMMSTRKSFIGQTMAAREGMIDDDRPALVGLKPVNTEQRLRGGAHLFSDVTVANADNREGWVTSVADSPAVGCWIGLGFLKGGRARIGEQVVAYYPLKNEIVPVEVCHPVFVDAEGERLRG